MSKLVEINFRPGERILRQFGWIALGGFGLLALCAWNEWLVFRHGLGAAREPVAFALLGLGGLSALFSLAFPRANAPLFVGLSVVAFPIGFVFSYVIMATLFYVVIAPVGAVMRLFGKDPMDRRLLPNAATYWVDARPPRAKADYFKQF
ncbi:MAG TPA: SxtJ family membrane protein [Myxococcota bacterium]|nr:SxtJ family membrane protein [Myxococcota bacterium]